MSEETILANALAKTTCLSECLAYLDEACAADPAMRSRMDLLLNSYIRTGSFLEKASPGNAEEAGADQPSAEKPNSNKFAGNGASSEEPGRQLLPFELIRRLSETRVRPFDSANARAQDLQSSGIAEIDPLESASLFHRLAAFLPWNQWPNSVAWIVQSSLIFCVAFASWQAISRAREAEAAQTATKRAIKTGKSTREERDAGLLVIADQKLAQQALQSRLYAKNMNLVQTAWEADDLEFVQDLLSQQRPLPGEVDQRNFEWYYWDRLSHSELWTVEIGPKRAAGTPLAKEGLPMAFSVDGMRFAVAAGHLREIHIWDTLVGKKIINIEEVPDEVSGLEFSKDRARLAAMASGQVYIWDVGTGKLLHKLLASGHISQATFAPDGKRIVGIVKTEEKGKKKQNLAVWDVSSGEEINRWQVAGEVAGTKFVTGKPSYSMDGKQIAGIVVNVSAEDSKVDLATVKIWDSSSGKEVVACPFGPGETFMSVIQPRVLFSPDSKRLAASYCVFDQECGNGVAQHSNQKKNQFNQPGGGMSGVVRVWEAGTGKELFALKGFNAGFTGLAFSPDARDLAAMDGATGDVKICDGTTGERRANIIGQSAPGRNRNCIMGSFPMGFDNLPAGAGLAYSPDGTLLMTCNSFGGTINLWNSADGTLRRNFKGHPGAVKSLVFRFDGKEAYSAGFDGTMKGWQLSTVYEEPQFELGAELTLSPNGDHLAECIRSQKANPEGTLVRVWNTITWRLICTIELPPVLYGETITFNQDGWILAVLSGSRKEGKSSIVKLYGVSRGLLYQSFEVPQLSYDGGFAMSADGKRMAFMANISAESKQLKVWNSSTEKEILSLPPWALNANSAEPNFGHLPLAFSPDGRRVASVIPVESGGKRQLHVKMNDSQTGDELADFPISGSEVSNLLFSPDSRLLAVASAISGALSEVVLWNTASLQQQSSLKRPLKPLGFLAFSTDAKRIAASGFASTAGQHLKEVKIWDTANGEEVLSLKGSRFIPNMAFRAER